MAGPANTHRRTACGQNIGNCLRSWYHKGERSGPKGLSQAIGQERPLPGAALGHRQSRNMSDDWIVRGPAFDFEDFPYGPWVQSICRQTVHSLGRQSHDFAGPQ